MIDRIISSLKQRRQNILDGQINCIPLPFKRLSDKLPGIEKDRYYLVSGSPKAGKSQITNFLFLYTPLLYAYNNPDKLRVKIFYFPLEETAEQITMRFMSFLLYTISNIRISPTDLQSTDAEKVLPQSVIDILESEKYQKILKFFNEQVIFLDSRNPTGMYKDIVKYANETGTTHYKKVPIKNKASGLIEEKTVFDYYEPADPKEYVLCIVDHISLITEERDMDLRRSINKLSEYMIILRNKYHYIPVVIQQQSTETGNFEAVKASKIRPTQAGLADSKYTGKDASVMLGITSPHAHELPQYLGYDITAFKGNIRFLEIVLNRHGECNGVVGLYFDGATNYFKELPAYNNKTEIDKQLSFIANTIRKKALPLFAFFKSKITKSN